MCGCFSSAHHQRPAPQPKHAPQTRNQTSNPLVCRPALNPMSHTSWAYLHSIYTVHLPFKEYSCLFIHFLLIPDLEIVMPSFHPPTHIHLSSTHEETEAQQVVMTFLRTHRVNDQNSGLLTSYPRPASIICSRVCVGESDKGLIIYETFKFLSLGSLDLHHTSLNVSWMLHILTSSLPTPIGHQHSSQKPGTGHSAWALSPYLTVPQHITISQQISIPHHITNPSQISNKKKQQKPSALHL